MKHARAFFTVSRLAAGSPSFARFTVGVLFLAGAWLIPNATAGATPLGSPAGDIIDIPLGPTSTGLTLLSSDSEEMRYRVELDALQAFAVTTSDGEFTRLVVPGFHASTTEGAPQLPMLNRLIEIPYAATARIEVTSRETREIDLGALGIYAPLMPAQPSLPKNVDPASWPFVLDRQAYTQPVVSQDLAKVVDLGRLRAVRVGRLEVSPVEYLPAANRIVVTESFELRIVFDNADLVAGADLRARTSSPFFDAIYGNIERDTHDDHPNPVGDVVTMVIVTPSQFEAQLSEFIEWKTERGFHVVTGVLGTSEVGTTKESVRAWLQDLYFNATAEQPAPSFVLFVGDVAQMPTWTLDGDPTDRPYCDAEGDLCPDILYGRFSATNAGELQAILDKTLMYDQFTMPDPSYLGEVVMIAGMDGTFGPTHGNGQINYGTTNYFNAAHGLYSYTYLYPGSGSHSGDIVQNVSDGVGYINYTAHGSETAWADPSFSQNQVRNLQNDGEYCLAVGNCCLTSSYDVGECFAETWLRVANKGAIGYIGGSNSTYWDEDYWWGVGYRSVVVPNPTYEDTGTGAYDGLFHDHGEAMEKWYVTNDALVFCGNLAVMESGSSLITYYWNIYNLMGDPSLSAYLGVPAANPVVHPPTLFSSWTTIPIEAIPGSYIGLTQNGMLVGAGTVDLSGTVDLNLSTLLDPGTAHLVVMAQNREPYIVDVPVIVPAQVFLDPLVIPCETESEVTVGVFEYDGITPKPGIDVWAEGFLYSSEHATTDASGHCTITVAYDFGPSIDIVGKAPADTWELFRTPLEVQAGSLIGAGINLSTDIGLSNQAPLHLPSTLHAMVSEPEFALHAVLNGTWMAGTSERSLEVTAHELGQLEGIIAVVGYDLVRRVFPVVEVHGTLAGHVEANGVPAVGAHVSVFDGPDLVFQTVVDASGNYDMGESIVCGPYRMEVELFGYLGWDQPIFVDFGANDLDVFLDPAPSGLLSGTITEFGTNVPLSASLEIYRSDTGGLYLTTESDPLDGSYVVPVLPYFDYIARVRAQRHVAVEQAFSITGPNAVLDFQLERTLANVLLVEDANGIRSQEAKIDPLTGRTLEGAYVGGTAKSSADLLAELEAIGYSVTMETTAATEPVDWPNYDLLVVSSGDNTSTLPDGTFRTALRTFVLGGGRLLIEGGEVGYNHYGETTFARDVLHITGWNHDGSGNLTIATPTHPVAREPNVLPSPISCSYAGYGDQDAVTKTTDAVRVGSWTNYASDASLIAFDPVGGTGDGRIVYYAFNYSALNAPSRVLLLENTIAWLLPQDPTNAPDPVAVPMELGLARAHPNPMTSFSTIGFSLPAEGVVDLSVFDVSGRHVKTLVDGTMAAGSHEVIWTGRDDRGLQVGNGVYFYRLAMEGATRIEKVTRIR